MIVLYRGPRGCGKTLTMVKDGYAYHELGWNVISNFKTSFSKLVTPEYILSLDKNSDIYNAVILIDEVQTLFDSRSFKSEVVKKFSYFLQQIRKRNIDVLFCTQYANTIDLRLRQQVDIVAFPKYNKKLDVCAVKYFDLTESEDLDFIKPNYREIYFTASDVFKLYDSFEMVK